MDSAQIQKELFRVTKNIKKLLVYHSTSQIKHSEYRALGIIYEEMKRSKENTEGIKTSELALKLKISKPAVSKLVSSLEEHGYIVRSAGKADKRTTFIALTEEGKRKTEALIQQMDCIIQRILKKMGEEDSKELVRLLKKVYTIIEQELKEHRKERSKECEYDDKTF